MNDALYMILLLQPEMEVVSLDVPFESERDAEIAFNSLSVDPEPKRSGLIKDFALQGKVLHVDFK